MPDVHDYLPKGQRKVNILEPRRFPEEGRDFFGLIAGDAAADGGDEEFEFFVLLCE